MTKTTDTTKTTDSPIIKDVLASLSVAQLQVALQQRQVQDGIDTLKAVATSVDPSDKVLQDILIKKLFAFRRKNAPKKTASGARRGRKPGSKNAPKVTTSATVPSDAPAASDSASV